MAQVDGSYACVTKTPMGEQASTLTVKTDGDRWTGSNAGVLGSLDCMDGKVEGNRLTWKMKMPLPMPMTLDCQATIEGDVLRGSINAGAFGVMPMSGTREG